jgi:hypothetical protein
MHARHNVREAYTDGPDIGAFLQAHIASRVAMAGIFESAGAAVQSTIAAELGASAPPPETGSQEPTL